MNEHMKSIMDDPSGLRVSRAYRSSIGLPYAFVMDGGVVLTARLGLTKRMALSRAQRRVDAIKRRAQRRHARHAALVAEWPQCRNDK